MGFENAEVLLEFSFNDLSPQIGSSKYAYALKESNYNYFIKLDNEFHVGYNFLYRKIIRIPRNAFPIIKLYLESITTGKNISASNFLVNPWLKIMKDAQFVIGSDVDELELIQSRYFQSLLSKEQLRLILLPTLWCNFDCPYCFEFKKRKFMSKEVEDGLLRWIEANFGDKEFINVSWFGGEPLLAKDRIIDLSKKLITFSEEIGARYQASLITNGYYLDQEFIEKLESLKIECVQITIDGDEQRHNELRRNRNGSDSYSRIYENIVAFCQKTTNCSLLLRINCCDENYEGITRMLAAFPEDVRKRVTMFFRWVFPNEASGYHDFSCERRGEDAFVGLARLYAEAQALGWKTVNPLEKSSHGYCEVDFKDHYSIDPDGNAYFCTHTYNGDDAIGSISTGELMLNETADIPDWYAANPFSDEECLSCKILPMCNGGCRRQRVAGGRGCAEEKDSLDLFVRNLVRSGSVPRSCC